jgi:Domain of unknown function (DUF1844)
MIAGEEPTAGDAGSTSAGADEPGPQGPSPPESAPQTIPVGAFATRDLLAWFLGLLAAKAWEGMGLVPNPGTNKIQKDLQDARIAIDAYAAIFEAVRAQIDDQPRREMETLLTTLRLNFVEKNAP